MALCLCLKRHGETRKFGVELTGSDKAMKLPIMSSILLRSSALLAAHVVGIVGVSEDRVCMPSSSAPSHDLFRLPSSACSTPPSPLGDVLAGAVHRDRRATEGPGERDMVTPGGERKPVCPGVKRDEAPCDEGIQPPGYRLIWWGTQYESGGFPVHTLIRTVAPVDRESMEYSHNAVKSEAC